MGAGASLHSRNHRAVRFALVASLIMLGAAVASTAASAPTAAPELPLSTPGTGWQPDQPVGAEVVSGVDPVAGSQAIPRGETGSVALALPSSGTPPYSWQWMYSTNGGASYRPATAAQCAIPGGASASAGAAETCRFVTNAATPIGTYLFSLRVTDSASSPESLTIPAASPLVVGATSGAPSFDTDPTEFCTGTCATANWFGGSGGSGALNLSTASANELLVLEVTDSGESGSGLRSTDLSDSRGSTWTLESANAWNGAGNNQYVFYAVDTVLGTDTITLDTAAGSHTSASSATAIITAFSGVDTSAPIETVGAFETGTGVGSTANVTTGVSPTTILGVVSTTNGASGFTPTSSPAFSQSGEVSDGVATSSYLEYYADTATGNYTSSPDWTGSVAWGEGAIAVQGTSPLSVTVAPTTVVVDNGQTATLTATGAGGVGALTYSWSIASGSCPGFATATTATLHYATTGTSSTCVITVTVKDTRSYTAQPLTPSAVTVDSTLTAPGAPAVSATKLDSDQAFSVSGTLPSSGTPTYSWQWLVEVNGAGGYVAATQCAPASGGGGALSTVETCAASASTLTVGDTYAFELKVTDSATTPESATSTTSSTVTVRAPLTQPSVPDVSATALDWNQALMVTDAIPSTGSSTYSWQWLIAVNGGSFVDATECSVNSGTGAAAGAQKTCTAPLDTLTVGYTYALEFQVTDSANVPETQISPVSSTVSVDTTMTTPAAASVSATKLDVDQSLTVTDTVPTTGTPGYSWQWEISVNGSAYVSATQCAVNSGFGAAAGALETCAISSGTFFAGGTYAFKFMVKDSASTQETATAAASSTVTARAALTAPAAPTVSSTTLDVNQALTVSATVPSTGTATYAWQWWTSVNGASFAMASLCTHNSGTAAAAGAVETCVIGASDLTVGSTYAFEFEVTDSASAPESETSSSSLTVSVDSALTAPAAPTASAIALDSDQTLLVTGVVPTSGTATYSWQWLVEVNGAGGYADASACGGSASGSGAAKGATETCTVPGNTLTANDNYSFELEVTDSGTIPESQISAPSPIVQVDAALHAPAAPVPSVTSLDADQSLWINATIPSTGTPTYSWEWLIEVNGVGGFGGAAACGASESGSGASGGTVETCVVPGNTLAASTSYAFELRVTDAATVAETATSAASAAVSTSSALTAGGPTPSTSVLDLGQSILLSATSSGGSGANVFVWYEGASAGACLAPIVGATTGTYLASPASTTYYCYLVTDSNLANATSSVTEVLVNPALASPATPAVTSTALDADQTLTVSTALPASGTPNYAWQWTVSIDGGPFANATQCAVNGGNDGAPGATVMCAIPANELIPGDSYNFALAVTDNATAPVSQSSDASLNVTVSEPLGVPSAPRVYATSLDDDQVLDVTDFIPSTGSPTYDWQWMVSIDGAADVPATQCLDNSGTGAFADMAVFCLVPAGGFLADHTYSFSLDVTDSASTPEVVISPASDVVSVSSSLTRPGAPTVSATALDANQILVVTATIPSTGTPDYSWTWEISTDGGAFLPATICAVNAGTGAIASATVTCQIAANVLAAGSTYAFAINVADSASLPSSSGSNASVLVTVSTALFDPAISASALQGPTGASYSVDGSGFSVSAVASVTFDGSLQVPQDCSVGSYSSTAIFTNASGAFSCSFVVPTEAGGAYSILAEDEGTHTATTEEMFEVTVPAILVAPLQATAGSPVTVSGTGFSVDIALGSLVFDSQAITACAVGSLVSNATGAFSCTFNVPSGASGSTVTATDAGGAAATASFTPLSSPGQSSSFPWIWVAIAAVVVLAALVAFLVLRRRRPSARDETPAEDSPTDSGLSPIGGPTSAPNLVDTMVGTGVEMSPPVAALSTPPPDLDRDPVAPMPDYALEVATVTSPPVDIGGSPSTESSAPVTEQPRMVPEDLPPAATATPTPRPVTPETELDVDGVLAELDFVSKEILKTPPKKAPPAKPWNPLDEAWDEADNEKPPE
jgi:hypothetical protein